MMKIVNKLRCLILKKKLFDFRAIDGREIYFDILEKMHVSCTVWHIGNVKRISRAVRQNHIWKGLMP